MILFKYVDKGNMFSTTVGNCEIHFLSHKNAYGSIFRDHLFSRRYNVVKTAHFLFPYLGFICRSLLNANIIQSLVLSFIILPEDCENNAKKRSRDVAAAPGDLTLSELSDSQSKSPLCYAKDSTKVYMTFAVIYTI